MNSPSVQGGDGGSRSACSFFSANSSMKLCRGAEAKTFGLTSLGKGTVTRAAATLLEYQTLTATSPGPWIVTLPSRLTPATISSLLENLAQRVTSSILPSA
jgi:hypothetical protein